MRPADIRSALQVGIEGARVVLPAAEYALTGRAGHANGGPLAIAAGVTLVGQEGVVLSGADRPVVGSEGVSFVSLHLPRGATIGSLTAHGGSLTMTKCTSTMGSIYADKGTSLVMEDSRMFGCRSQGMICRGDVKATRCTIECMSVAAPESRPRSSWLTA